MVDRRKFLKAGAIAGSSLVIPWSPLMKKAYGVPLDSSVGLLSDPALQPKFVEQVPNALNPAFTYMPHPGTGVIHALMTVALGDRTRVIAFRVSTTSCACAPMSS